jgi:hypothetical protein
MKPRPAATLALPYVRTNIGVGVSERASGFRPMGCPPSKANGAAQVGSGCRDCEERMTTSFSPTYDTVATDSDWGALQVEAGTEHWITRAELRLVLGYLQPDRAPEDQKAGRAKASEIFKRLLDKLEQEGRVLSGRFSTSRY